MQGRTCVVTGATSGIGEAAATELARRGAQLVLIARNREKGEATCARIREASGQEAVEVFYADLAVQADIRRVAEAVLKRCERIDLLFNNAGIVNWRREETPDGIEATFAVNHLAYFLLTNLLLDRLRASGEARIVNTASEAHRFGSIDWDDLQSERRYGVMRDYGKSKLCNLLFTRELAQRLAGSRVSVNAYHPGAVATGLAQQNGWGAQLLTRVLSPFFRTPEQGAATAIQLACEPELAGTTGRYFADGKEKRPSRAALDDADAARLWSESEALVGL